MTLLCGLPLPSVLCAATVTKSGACPTAPVRRWSLSIRRVQAKRTPMRLAAFSRYLLPLRSQSRRLPHSPREEVVEIAACVPGAILAERRERDEAAALARLAALHARVQVTNGMPDSAP